MMEKGFGLADFGFKNVVRFFIRVEINTISLEKQFEELKFIFSFFLSFKVKIINDFAN